MGMSPAEVKAIRMAVKNAEAEKVEVPASPDQYEQIRRHYEQGHWTAFSNLDQWFLTLSGTAIALLVAAATADWLKSLANSERTLLFWSGMLFAVCVLAAMLAKLLAWAMYGRAITLTDNAWLESVSERKLARAGDQPQLRQVLMGLNVLCVIAFGAAMVVLFFFLGCRVLPTQPSGS